MEIQDPKLVKMSAEANILMKSAPDVVRKELERVRMEIVTWCDIEIHTGLTPRNGDDYDTAMALRKSIADFLGEINNLA
jgi:hypothetical protein